MSSMPDSHNEKKGLRSRSWRLSYRTSSTIIDGRPVDMLHDFYIPALQLAVRYDRVAGYFRSTSLAAASQGFSSFVARKGKMRLIVGADLEPDDVIAILRGDAQRLESRLNDELQQPDTWPERVRNGVTLLAWMVANGYLEVRVGFRLHKVTGEPIAFDDVDDGYVHEKWFIMYDEFGNRMYGSGTLNESKTALVLNAENLDVHCDWKGETDRERVEEAIQSFEKLWNGEVPHLPVLTLPEAVHRRLVQFAEGVVQPVEVDGTSAAPMPSVVPPSAMERLKFAVLRDGPRMPGGRYVGMETAPVDPWPHQKVVVRRLVETWPYSYLLCDEVGLGKTIEAGLAFRSLYLSGLAKRILIAAPAGLTPQWQRQMASKMLMSFGRVCTAPGISHDYVFPYTEQRPADSMYEPDLTIISTGLLSRQERVSDLRRAESFDIVLVDEAHAARRSNPTKGTGALPEYGQLYKTLQNELRPKAKSLWLATATPMQIHPVEVYDLLALSNRVGIFQFDPTLTHEFYSVIDKLVREREPNAEEWTFLRRAVSAIRDQDPMLWRFFEQNVIDGRIRTTVNRWLEFGQAPRGKDRERMLRLIFSAAPLSRVMMRHTRKLLEVYRTNGQLQQNLAKRHVQPLRPISFNSLERRIYDQLEEYCKGLTAQIQQHGDRQHRMMSFLLSFLRLRFASSLYAFQETMKRRLQKVEATLRHQRGESVRGAEEERSLVDLIQEYEEDDDAVAVESLLHGRSTADLEWEQSRIQEMLRDMEHLNGDSSKMRELLATLDQRRIGSTSRFKQTVIFTRFYDTLTDIVRRLQHSRPDMRLGTYSGQGATWFNPDSNRMMNVDREEVKERFLRGEIDILVCTDAAAEGLNLQTADMLINFDLGWNPMKIEQRIGRIDRIGQKYEHIFVVNLCYEGSEEEVVYGRLLNRLMQANLIVGTQQISLLPVEPDEFRQLAEGTLTPEELEQRSIERLAQQKQQTARMEIPPEELFDIYRRLTETSSKSAVPVNLEAIWDTLAGSVTLQSAGCVVKRTIDETYMEVNGIDGIPDGTVLTISRRLYEEGLAESGRRVHFASYGDPLFESLLTYMGQWELPACIRKISVAVEGFEGVEVVGYAVVCRGAGGIREIRLIRSWRELQGITLLEEEAISDHETEVLREQLTTLAREEFEPYLAAERIERENRRAARVQELLNCWIVRDLLQVKAGSDVDGAPFWPTLREAENMAEERDRVLISEMPLDILRTYQQHLAYDCTLPSMGDKAPVHVPRFALKAAVDAAKRAAEAMKSKRSELLVGRVIARLERDAAELRRLIASNAP